jgi:YggT family protein
MAIFADVLFYLIQFFILVMWIRLILDFVRSARPTWRPQGFLLVLLSIVFAITDPPLKVVRRVIRPVRFGAVSIDFAWTIVLIVAFIVSNIVAGLGRA